MHSIMKVFAVFLVLVSSTVAIAGEKKKGTGTTRELACWVYNYKANKHAYSRSTCYKSCKPEQTTYNGTVYVFRASVPNQEGSCKQKKYDRKPVSEEKFLAKYPKPGTAPGSSNGGGKLPEPKRGVNTVQKYVNPQNSERYILTIQNTTKDRGITFYSVKVRDSRYSFPARVIDQGEVILEPGGSWSKEFLQWGAADWDVKAE